MNYFKTAIHSLFPVFKDIVNAIWRGSRRGTIYGLKIGFEMFIWLGAATIAHLALKHWGGVDVPIYYIAVLTALGQIQYATRIKKEQ